MSEWQPIETAPKDGSEVLLYLGAPWEKIEKARWYSPWGNWQCGVIPSDPAREEYFGIGSSVPTHWMPLPKPPNTRKPIPKLTPRLTHCAASQDGECSHATCPQLRDNEPATSGRHCPLDGEHDD